MKTYWLVVTKFYDSGKVHVYMEQIEREEKPVNKFVSTKSADTYFDYFDNEKKAQNFYKQALKA